MSPFASKAQMRYLYSQHPAMAKEWAGKTENMKALPEHVKGAKKSTKRKARKRMSLANHLRMNRVLHGR